MKKLRYLAGLVLLTNCSSPTTDRATQAATNTIQSAPAAASHQANPLPDSHAPGMATAASVKVAILVYPSMELLDFAGPAEVFSNTRDVQVYLVSTEKKAVTTAKNTVRLTADYTVADAPLPDILVVPGGPPDEVTDVYRNPAVMAWLKKANQGTQLTMSVCTGAFILSQAGLTHHKSVTSHWSAVDSLQRFDPQAKVLKDKRFVEDGKLLTTAGVSAGIDGALRVVEELRGHDEAVAVARMMEYDKWQPELGVVLGQSCIRPPAALAVNVARDPVCQMAVPSQEALTLAYHGTTYHFCSKSCRDNFRRHPEDYAKQ